jgi:hypothetical protein
MTTARTKIKDITDAELARKTHPSLSTTGIDLIVLKTIDDLAKEEVRKYNLQIKSINSDQKELNGLKEKNDETSLNRKKELEENIEKKNSDVKKYEESLEGGKVTREIIASLKNTEVKNPENAIRDNLQLEGYIGKDLNKVTPISAEIYVQKILNSKFRNNDIRNMYSKRNLNYFNTLQNDSEIISPVGPGVPRGV